jgi:hypothetical protein
MSMSELVNFPFLFFANRCLFSQELKHADSGIRCSFKRKANLSIETIQNNAGVPTRNKAELHRIDRALNPSLDFLGFSLFCESDGAKGEVKMRVEKRAEALKAKCIANGSECRPELPVVAIHSERCKLWRELSKSDQSKWETTAASMSEARSCHLSTSR